MSEPNNLALWDSVCKTDKRFVKEITGGTYGAAKLSTVDQTYIFHKATELWGPFGSKWGVKDISWSERIPQGATLPTHILLDGILFYPGGEIPQRASWPFTSKGVDYEFSCMTHFVKKGLSRLGFTADIYLGKFADEIDRVISPKTGQSVDAKESCEAVLTSLKEADTVEKLTKRYVAATTAGFGPMHMSRINDEFLARKSELETSEHF
jgi:hypothetical protein